MKKLILLFLFATQFISPQGYQGPQLGGGTFNMGNRNQTAYRNQGEQNLQANRPSQFPNQTNQYVRTAQGNWVLRDW
jgi:hypothetical protein